MADSKITALTALTAADPANDMIPIVDVSDTPPASGNTKRISINNILAASGTATLASATITGDLTVDTSTLKADSANNRVGILTASPTHTLDVRGIIKSNGTYTAYVNPSFTGAAAIQTESAESLILAPSGQESLRCAPSGVYTFGDGLGGTRMTLNATGLGVGASPGLTGGSRRTLTVNAPTGQLSILELGINGSIAGYLFSNATQTTLAAVGATFFSVETNAVERLRVDATGNLLVGTTTNTNASRVFARGTGGATTLAVQSSTGDTANPGVLIGKFDNDSTTSQILVRFTINNSAAGSGQITANGANQAAFGSFSDSRLKENILNLPSQLSNILSLRPVEFDYKDGSGHQIGFVAQEMQEVYSDAVGEQNGFLTVTGWSKTEARLVSAIKELAAKVQALEAKLA